jgi:hypothetical protein
LSHTHTVHCFSGASWLRSSCSHWPPLYGPPSKPIHLLCWDTSWKPCLPACCAAFTFSHFSPLHWYTSPLSCARASPHLASSVRAPPTRTRADHHKRTAASKTLPRSNPHITVYSARAYSCTAQIQAKRDGCREGGVCATHQGTVARPVLVVHRSLACEGVAPPVHAGSRARAATSPLAHNLPPQPLLHTGAQRVAVPGPPMSAPTTSTGPPPYSDGPDDQHANATRTSLAVAASPPPSEGKVCPWRKEQNVRESRAADACGAVNPPASCRTIRTSIGCVHSSLPPTVVAACFTVSSAIDTRRWVEPHSDETHSSRRQP